MEKHTPHHKLTLMQALATAGKVRTTHAARTGASELGLTFLDILEIMIALTSRDFYKSMTTYADHTLWQDVYRPVIQVGGVYLKLTVVDDLLIVSFKEL